MSFDPETFDPSKPNASRLAVENPEFRYPPGRNPYFKKLRELAGRAFADNETEQHRGQWRGLMPDAAGTSAKRELHVELGCNAGHVLVEWAKRDPARAYIGIDWKIKAIHRAAEKLVKKDVKNALFLRAHAARLPYIFGEGEIDRLHLFFPDPWPKKAHWKHRFVNEQRLRLIAPALKKGGLFEIKTDHQGYFEWMEEELAKCQDVWRVLERTTDLHAGVAEPAKLEIPQVTLFEKLFIKDGIRIKRLLLERL